MFMTRKHTRRLLSTEPPSRAHTVWMWVLAVALVAVTAACGSDPTAPYDQPTFRVEVSGEEFIVQVTDAGQIAELEARMASGAEGVINGSIRPGNGGFNAPWSWHMDPATVAAPDLAIEVCDGRPSMVEADLDYWLETLGQFCPWGATVVERLD